jgi:hypothetical protein
MAAGELAEAIGGGGRAGFDGLAVEMAADVGGQRVDGGVAAVGVLFERLHDDPIEVAGEGTGEAAIGDAGAGARRVLFTDAAKGFELGDAAESRAVEGGRAGEELVQEDAERVEVAAGVHGGCAGAGLLGAHVLESADDGAELGDLGAVGEAQGGAIDGAGDAEVDDLGGGLAVIDGDEDVGGLDVAVDDAALVRVLDGLADGDEEAEAGWDVEMGGIAVLRDGDAVDELHDEVEAAGVGGSGVERTGNEGVVHEGERLALGLEAGDGLLGVHSGLDDLEGDLALDGMELLGAANDAHAAAAESTEDPVGTDEGAGAVEWGGRRSGAGVYGRVSVARNGVQSVLQDPGRPEGGCSIPWGGSPICYRTISGGDRGRGFEDLGRFQEGSDGEGGM